MYGKELFGSRIMDIDYVVTQGQYPCWFGYKTTKAGRKRAWRRLQLCKVKGVVIQTKTNERTWPARQISTSFKTIPQDLGDRDFV